VLDRNDVLFRIHGVPIYRESLVVYQSDNDTTDPQVGVVCMVLDFVYDSELEMHVVQVLMEGRVLYLLRSDLRPVSV
jgi:hypothetical protein